MFSFNRRRATSKFLYFFRWFVHMRGCLTGLRFDWLCMFYEFACSLLLVFGFLFELGFVWTQNHGYICCLKLLVKLPWFLGCRCCFFDSVVYVVYWLYILFLSCDMSGWCVVMKKWLDILLDGEVDIEDRDSVDWVMLYLSIIHKDVIRNCRHALVVVGICSKRMFKFWSFFLI